MISMERVLFLRVGKDQMPERDSEACSVFRSASLSERVSVYRGIGRTTTAATVVAAGFCLSYIVEVLQFLLPERFSSLTDVLANSAGAVAALSVWRWYPRFTPAPVACRDKATSK